LSQVVVVGGGITRVSLYVGVRRYISLYLRTRRAWASAHHLGTSRVHSPTPPPRVRTHPPGSDGRTTRSHHSRWEAPSTSSFRTPRHRPLLACRCVYPSQMRSSVSGYYYHPTAHAPRRATPYFVFKSIHFETADNGVQIILRV